MTGKGTDDGPSTPYDVVLIDSRTGVTEIGGICTYQLADSIVMFCAANQQNVEGTRDMADDFLSPKTLSLRGGRPLQVIVVPARVEQQDSKLLTKFHKAFDKEFSELLPPAFSKASLGLWDLMIPYDADFAFEERVPSEPNPDGYGLAGAFDKLSGALALLASPGTSLAALDGKGGRPGEESLAVPQYDPTQRFASWDAYLSYNTAEREDVRKLADLLEARGLRVFRDEAGLLPGDAWVGKLEEAILQSRVFLCCLGRSGLGTSCQTQELRWALDKLTRKGDSKLVPVLLPGVDPALLPQTLVSYQWADFREGVDEGKALDRLLETLSSGAPPKASVEYGSPYPGLQPFDEKDAGVFFGRDALVARLLDEIRKADFLAVVGPSGCGKTSLIQAGLVPVLRSGMIKGSESWNFRILRPGPRPLSTLVECLEEALLPEQRLFLFVDQFEEVFTLCQDEQERRGFIDRLAQEARHSQKKIVVLLGIRSDFIGHCTRKSDGLLTGSALDRAQDLLDTRQHDLSLEEREYIEASLKNRRRVQQVKISSGFFAVALFAMSFYTQQQARIAKETIQSTVDWVREVVQEVPASVSSRDRRLLALREGGSVRLLDSSGSGKLLWEERLPSQINNMDFDPTSRFLVLVTDGSIGILEVRSLQWRELEGGPGPFVDIQFNPDGKTFVL